MTLQQKINLARPLTHLSFYLMLLAMAANAWLQGAPAVIYFLCLFPLMIFIPGLISNNTRTLIWICFVILMYFAMAVDNLAGPAPQVLDWVELALTVILFNAAMMYARWKQALGSQLQAQDQEPAA
jgi:uncharacterized membrane protein